MNENEENFNVDFVKWQEIIKKNSFNQIQSINSTKCQISRINAKGKPFENVLHVINFSQTQNITVNFDMNQKSWYKLKVL